MKKKLLIITSVLLLVGGISFAQEETISAPNTFQEAFEMVRQAFENAKQRLPEIIRGLWYNEVLPRWQSMYDWVYINIWLKIKNFFLGIVKPRVEQEYEKRKPQVEEEYEKEKEEFRQELPDVLRGIWRRFRELWE